MIYDLVASGYVSMDRIIKLRQPTAVGKTSIILNGDSQKIYYGGCGVNVSYLLAKLGKKTLPILRVGDDCQQTGFTEYLAQGGVSLAAVSTVSGAATSFAYLLEDSQGDHITLFHPGAMEGKYALEPLDEWFQSTKLALITVASPQDNQLFLDKARKHQVPLLFGMKMDEAAFPKDLLVDILSYATVLFANQSESARICSMLNLHSIKDLFTRTNLQVIVTTQGAQGCIFVEGSSDGLITGQIAAARVNTLCDTAGSGDAFIAGYAYGMLEGASVRRCVEYGSTMAAFIVEAIGCTTSAPELPDFIKRHQDNYRRIQ